MCSQSENGEKCAEAGLGTIVNITNRNKINRIFLGLHGCVVVIKMLHLFGFENVLVAALGLRAIRNLAADADNRTFLYKIDAPLAILELIQTYTGGAVSSV